MRVQIPAYTDRWMMNDRYGEVISSCKPTKTGQSVWKVRLDSGATVRVLVDDCTPV